MVDMTDPLTGIETTAPGGNRRPIDGRTSLCQLPWCGKIDLRGDSGDAKFVKAAGKVFGIPLPLDANTTSASKDSVIFWLGPDQWLLHCDIARTEILRAELTQQLAPLHHAATDVTDYYTVLELSGENSDQVLARGCPLDLHEREFKATQCAQTRFGNASILLYKPNADSSFQIQVRWSHTEYVWDYLATVIQTL